ncbi:MAG: hypothetical protein IJC87_02850 [Clostridia bacterium]|nr:hypothetical protein [Clostridia bacterium]
MNIYEIFSFLINNYKLNYVFQEFDLGGGFVAQEYSFYNKTGCFTIHSLPVRDELEFYYAKSCYANINSLHENPLDVYNFGKDIWDKKSKWFKFIPNPFFWLDKTKILRTVADIIKLQIATNKEFFGVKI